MPEAERDVGRGEDEESGRGAGERHLGADESAPREPEEGGRGGDPAVGALAGRGGRVEEGEPEEEDPDEADVERVGRDRDAEEGGEERQREENRERRGRVVRRAGEERRAEAALPGR